MIYYLTIIALIVIIGNFVLEIFDHIEARKEHKKVIQNHRLNHKEHCHGYKKNNTKE